MNNYYGFGKTVTYAFDNAVTKVIEALKKEGFGVLTDIDVAETVKKKLDKTIPPYRILGACNPELAYQVLEIEPSIGLLLPCNVVVRQDESNQVHIEFMDPDAVLKLVNNSQIKSLSCEVKQRLEKVMQAL